MTDCAKIAIENLQSVAKLKRDQKVQDEVYEILKKWEKLYADELKDVSSIDDDTKSDMVSYALNGFDKEDDWMGDAEDDVESFEAIGRIWFAGDI